MPFPNDQSSKPNELDGVKSAGARARHLWQIMAIFMLAGLICAADWHGWPGLSIGGGYLLLLLLAAGLQVRFSPLYFAAAFSILGLLGWFHGLPNAGGGYSPAERGPGILALWVGAILMGRHRGVWLATATRASALERKSESFDLARQQLAEQALFESEVRQRFHTENGAEMVTQLDPRTGKIIYVSAAVQGLLGYTPAEVVGKPVGEFLAPESRQKVFALLRTRIARLRGLAAGTNAYQDEFSLCGKDDSTVAVTVTWTFRRNERERLDILAVVRDRSERIRMEREVLRRIELEQERIGRDLHDGLCQILVATKYHGALLAKQLRDENLSWALGELNFIEQSLGKAILQTRDLAKGLNPVQLESKGLASVLMELAEFIQTTSNAQCQFQVSGAATIPTGEVARQLYRITQEALQNALKHGQARNIFIVLKEEAGKLRLSVADDGAGLANNYAASSGSGLRNMMTRAAMIGGRFEIRRGLQGGCVAEVNLPVIIRQD